MGVTDILYLNDFAHSRSGDGKMLTSELDCGYIQQLIILCDMNSNDMSRGEVIGLIKKMTGATFEKAEQHWYYCRRARLLPELKNHGFLQIAQATTMKRNGVTTKKLMRWYGTVDETLNELDCLNSWHDD